MKYKKYILILALFIFFPLMVYANEPGVTCTDEEMLEMQEEIKNVTIDVELMPEGSKLESFYVESADISNTFKVSTKNLPQGYRIDIYADKNNRTNYGITNGTYSIIRDGGVYAIDFRNTKCGLGIIKSYEMLIPYYDVNNKDNVWFDGTYAYNPEQNKQDTKETLSIRLVVLLIMLIAVVAISIVLLFKKNKIKVSFSILIFVVLSLSFICGANNVYATSYEVDSGGEPKSPSSGGSSGAVGLGIYVTTGVGFKVSLVNVKTMGSVSDFIVLGKSDGLSKPWSSWSSWYRIARDVAGNEGLYGKIGNSYSISKTTYSNCETIDSGSRCVKDDVWFLIEPGDNTPNIDSSKITNKLFTKSGSKYTPTNMFYKYLLKLLKGYENNLGISSVSNVDEIKKLLDDNSKLEERKKLLDYRIIVEPIYIAGNIQNIGITDYHIYTLKAIYNKDDVKISSIYEYDFYNNFYALKEHGQINNPFNNNIKDSKSGYGYVIYSIVDEEEVCDPKTQCCFDSSGNYNKYSDGAYIRDNYRCPSGVVGEDNKCTTSVVTCSSTCEDTTTPAECSGTEGTTVEFHENDKLSSCTIEKDNSSGFTIVDNKETNNFCEVACKDDIDILLPTEKMALSGSYFKLDQYTPEIKTKRTCVTTSIDYNKLDSVLKSKEEEIANLYNIWQDWVYINGDIDTALPYSGPSHIIDPTDSQFVECGCFDVNTSVDPPERVCTGSYTKYTWEITGAGGPNRKVYYKGATGVYLKGCKESESGAEGIYMKDVYVSMINAEKAYKKALEEYRDIINAYNKCYSWVDNTKNTNLDIKTHEYHINVLDESANEPYRKEFEYVFKPDVTFQYQEKGDYWYPTEYTFDYDKDVTCLDKGVTQTDDVERKYESRSISPVTSKTYWQDDASNKTDDYYQTGSKGETPYIRNRNLIDCNGTTCSSDDLKISTTFFSSRYVLRNESYDYIYHLPVLSTIIPNGLVKKKGNYNDYISPKDVKKESDEVLLIEEDKFINAAPVSIKTEAGIYEYKLSVENLIYKKLTPSNISGDLRYRKHNINSDDNFEDRFISSRVLSGNSDDGKTYVCTYEVINDIYKPKGGYYLFFYRPVEITNINPLGRELGYNWTDEKADIVKSDMYATGNNYQLLTNGKTDKFEFTLTPATLNAVRKYNNLTDYSKFSLVCTDTEGDNYHCNSKFLECLASLSGVASSGNLCNNILDSRGLGVQTDYNYEDFIYNRKILVDKQIALNSKG